MKKEKKDIIILFIVLALYSLAGGLYYNFQELWLAENNLSLKTISTVLSLCAIITVSFLFICSNVIKQKHIKKFTCILLIAKFLSIMLLYFLNGTGNNVLIKFFTMIEYAIDTEIYACLYPLITMIKKDDKIYAKRTLVYDAMYYIGVVIVGILLGKSFGTFTITYNSYLLFTAIIILLSFFILMKLDLKKYIKKKKEEPNDIKHIFRIIKKDKISIYYLCNIFVGNIAHYILLGMTISILTQITNFKPVLASNLVLITGLLATAIAYIILIKLTFKSDYINLLIKFGGRVIFYIIAFIINNKITVLIALFYTLILSSAYNNVSDAPYINRFDGKKQLEFYSLKEMIGYFSRAIGTFLCGLAFTLGIRINFLWAAIFTVVRLVFIFSAINLKNKEKESLAK